MKHNSQEDCDVPPFQKVQYGKEKETITVGKPEKQHVSPMIKVNINSGNKSC